MSRNHHFVNLRIAEISGHCPVQGWGQVNGRPWLFHARHDSWRIYLGETTDPLSYVNWATDGEVVASGQHAAAGWMDHDEAEAYIRRALSERAGRLSE